MDPSEPLLDLYARLSRDLAPLAPACRACGACCDFARFDHVLCTTAWEAAVLRDLHGPRASVSPAGCPYQEAGRCAAREGRPLGCRLYFCRPGDAAEALETLSIRYHEALETLHRTHGVPWRYGPLHQWLGASARG